MCRTPNDYSWGEAMHHGITSKGKEEGKKLVNRYGIDIWQVRRPSGTSRSKICKVKIQWFPSRENIWRKSRV